MTEAQRYKLRELLLRYDGIEELRDRSVLRNMAGIGTALAGEADEVMGELEALDKEIADAPRRVRG